MAARAPRALTMLACALGALAVLYGGGYALARSQGWLVHFAYAQGGRVAGHDVGQGQASGEIGGARGLVPDGLGARPLGAELWVLGWTHAHRAFVPLATLERALWSVREPAGSPWRYQPGAERAPLLPSPSPSPSPAVRRGSTWVRVGLARPSAAPDR